MDNQQDINAQQTFQDNVALDQQALVNYVTGLIQEKNSPYITEANSEDVKNGMIDDVTDAINQRMIDELTDPQVKALNDLLDNEANDEELGKFFTEKIPHLSQLVSEVLLDFRAGYLSIIPKEDEVVDAQDEPFIQNNEKIQSSQDLSQAIRDQLAVLSTPELPDHINMNDNPPSLTAAPIALEEKQWN